MKTKVTKNEVMNGYSKVAEIYYCNLQTVLHTMDAKYFTCGVYGWNSDIYEVNESCAISTGYRPFGNVKPNYNIVRLIEKKAKKIYANKVWKLETKNRKAKELLLELFK